MAWSIVQQSEGAENVGAATVAATLTSPATAGNLILVVVGADDWAATPPTGYTESPGCKQQTNLGHYVWWKVAAGGETSVSYTIGSVTTSVWQVFEIAGLTASPYDISAGQFAASGSSAYTTPSITPTAGERLIVASMGGSMSAANFTGLSAWLNSFVEQDDTTNTKASGTRDIIGMATLSATADGLTGYSSGATYSPNATARTGIAIAFKVASGATTVNGTAALTGAGSVAAVAAVVILGAAALTAAGTLTASSGGTTTTAGTALTAAATLTATGVVRQLATATLTGAGALTGSSGAATNGTASLTAAGSVTAAALVAVPGAASLAGSGLLTAAGSVRVLATAALAGSGSLAPAGVGIIRSTAVLTGVGSVTATAAVPGLVVVRPSTGTTARPSTGIVTRPDTGVVSRP